jgi:hypothetical protein
VITYLGGQSVRTFAPAIGRAMVVVDALVAPVIGRAADLRAQLSSSAPTLPDPTLLAASLAGALAAIPAMLAAAAKGQVAQRISLAADLASAESLAAPATSLAASMGAVLSTGGLQLYAYQGSAASMGAELASAIGAGLPGGGGAKANVYALVVVTESPAAFAALGEVVRTS